MLTVPHSVLNVNAYGTALGIKSVCAERTAGSEICFKIKIDALLRGEYFV